MRKLVVHLILRIRYTAVTVPPVSPHTTPKVANAVAEEAVANWCRVDNLAPQPVPHRNRRRDPGDNGHTRNRISVQQTRFDMCTTINRKQSRIQSK